MDHHHEPDADWELLRSFLPDDWEEQGWRLGAITWANKIQTAEQLLRLLLVCGGVGLSYQRTAEVAVGQLGQSLSKVAVFKRLRRAEPWLDWLVAALLAPQVEAQAPLAYRFRAVDASTVASPRAKVQLRLHYSLDLGSLRAETALITDEHEAESLEHFAVGPGEVLLGDRIYAKAKGLAHVVDAGAAAIVRLGRTSLNLYDQAGRKLDVLSLVRGLKGYQPGEWEAWFPHPDGSGRRVSGRICAVRLSPAAATKARAKLRRKGRKPRVKTYEMAGYFVVFTTSAELALTEVLAWYRARWQVELAFKRLKSLLGVGKVPDLSPASALAWLKLKMVYALLLYSYLDQAGAFSPWGHRLRGATVGLEPGVGADGAGQTGAGPRGAGAELAAARAAAA